MITHTFIGFGPVDDQKREFTVDMFLRQRWKDLRLSYTEQMAKSGKNHIKELRMEVKD